MARKPRGRHTRWRRAVWLLLAGAMLLASAVWLRPGIHPSLAVVDEVRVQATAVAGEVVRAARRLAATVPNVVLDQPYFAVEEIKVFGAKEADRAEIVAGAGLRRGLSIWRIDPRDLERRIERHPWVKRALVRRELPRRVVVSVEEWRPAAIVALRSLYYVDAEGIVFKAVDRTDPVDFPLVTGLRAAGLSPGDRSTRARVAEALAVARAVEQPAFRLSEIRFVPGGEIVLYPASSRVPFAMGWGDWAEKAARLERFLAEWNGQEAHFAAVDMSFAGQAVVRLRRTL